MFPLLKPSRLEKPAKEPVLSHNKEEDWWILSGDVPGESERDRQTAASLHVVAGGCRKGITVGSLFAQAIDARVTTGGLLFVVPAGM